MFWLCLFPPYLQNRLLVLLAGPLRSGGDDWSPEMVEILTCTKDWEAVDARLQQQVEDKSLALEEECYSELYLDVPSELNSCN